MRGGRAHWLERRVLLALTRTIGRRQGHRDADIALYWLNRGLGRWIGRDDVRHARVGEHLLVVPVGDPNLRMSYLAGHNEPDIERLAAAVLRPGDIAVDVGANIGWHTLRFAAAVGPRGHVFAFEPGARARALLATSIELNAWSGRVTVRAEAVGDRTGSTPLYPDGGAGLMSSTYAHGWLRAASAESVTMTTLDASLLPALDRPPRLVKVDVEGTEPEVLRGATRLFDRAPPEFVILELSSMRDGRQTVELMARNGYEGVQLRDGVLRPAAVRAPAPSAASPWEAGFEFRNACFRRRAAA
jgi:FkbM family methyltransferase